MRTEARVSRDMTARPRVSADLGIPADIAKVSDVFGFSDMHDLTLYFFCLT